jgi:hypothetical protein
MALTPQEFYEHALSVADADRRLPLARMTGWEISPFEESGLRVTPLGEPVVPERARKGAGGVDCSACEKRDEGIWFNDRWRLGRLSGFGVPMVLMLYPRDHYDLGDLDDDRAGELGVITAHVARHIEAVPHISRSHVYRVGDGAEHLHVWFFARPLGQTQLYGSWLPIWDDLLPEYPEDIADIDGNAVADALVASYGGSRTP